MGSVGVGVIISIYVLLCCIVWIIGYVVFWLNGECVISVDSLWCRFICFLISIVMLLVRYL